MSTEAYQRAMNRENKLWGAFVYAFPCSEEQTTERILVFGLYSNSYKNLHGYLIEVEASDLANLVDDYNSKIAGLTNEENITVLAIVTKRYLAGVDTFIHDQKMLTEQEKINSESAVMDAKFAALGADRATLATLALKVEVETNKNIARIAELEALIALEGAELDLVGVEISKKNLGLAEANLKVLKAASEILKLQLLIVEAGLEITKIDLDRAEMQLKTVGMEVSTAKLANLDNELAMAVAQTGLEVAQGGLIDAETEDLRNTVTNVETETTFYETLDTSELAMGIMRVDLANAKKDAKLSSYDVDIAQENAQLVLEKAKGALIDANTTSLKDKTTNVNTEKDFYTINLNPAEVLMGISKTGLVNAETVAKLKGYDNDKTRHAISLEYKRIQGQLEMTNVNATIAGRAAKSAANANENNAQVSIAFGDYNAEVAAATEMAAANITSTLTHTIGTAAE